MIRPATIDDIPRMVELGHQLHQNSRYASQEYDGGIVSSFIEGLISGHGVAFVAEISGQVVGGFLGGITEQWFSTQKVAFDYSFFIEPKHRHGITAVKLLKAFEHWAVGMGADHIQIGITTDINTEGTSRFYRAMGFDDIGQFFGKEVTHGR